MSISMYSNIRTYFFQHSVSSEDSLAIIKYNISDTIFAGDYKVLQIDLMLIKEFLGSFDYYTVSERRKFSIYL